ncbi:MAG: hypothetical protein GY714_07660 [Desulfobacterales bacterium]|nr:hypothetical protein [Desulfobacterales bacterium]MCP4161399.1 hypothetical protein [Deltaproteobacteria bacterium]
MKKLLIFGLFIALSGCSSVMKNSVINRAAFDFNCSKRSLKVQEIGIRTYGVTGCGKRATYIVRKGCISTGNCQAIMNSMGRN